MSKIKRRLLHNQSLSSEVCGRQIKQQTDNTIGDKEETASEDRDGREI